MARQGYLFPKMQQFCVANQIHAILKKIYVFFKEGAYLASIIYSKYVNPEKIRQSSQDYPESGL